MHNIWFYGLIVVLILLSAFFSATEIVFAKANRRRVERAVEEGRPGARTAYRIMEQYTRSISTVLVGNNLVNIAASTVATVLGLAYGATGQAVAGVLITVFILIFGEILPKIIGTEYADKLVFGMGRVLHVFMVLFAPVVAAVTAMVGRLEKIWTPKEVPIVTVDEVVTLLETIEEEGVFTEEEGELIKSAIEFVDVTARDILIPRVDVYAYDLDDSLDELMHDKDKLSFSRLPVYEENIDNMVGILPTRALIKAYVTDGTADVRSLLTPPLYVHMTRNISDILTEMRHTNTQMAVVVDEFGGTMGILTMEDILEEIVGEIYDEHDEIEPEGVLTETGDAEVDGGMNIYDMFDLVEYENDDFDSEYTTVSGWVTEMLDRFPQPGDSFTFDTLTVTVLGIDGMVAERVLVSNRTPDPEDE